jgi:hypothetical protein
MIDLWTHALLFLGLAFPIVVLGAFYTDPEDAPALRSVPKRYGVFVVACAAVAAVMLVLESLFASVG